MDATRTSCKADIDEQISFTYLLRNAHCWCSLLIVICPWHGLSFRGIEDQGPRAAVHAFTRRSVVSRAHTPPCFCLYSTVHVQYPFAQVRLQHAVIGRDRLPTFADAPLLTYVGPIIEGIIRWHSGVPTVLAHAAEDDWYEGMPIPERHGIHTQRLALRP